MFRFQFSVFRFQRYRRTEGQRGQRDFPFLTKKVRSMLACMEHNRYLCDVVSNKRTFICFMKYSELEAELTAAGCMVVRKGGNHLIWLSPITGKKFPLGHHGAKEVPPSTVRSVRRLAGLKKS